MDQVNLKLVKIKIMINLLFFIKRKTKIIFKIIHFKKILKKIRIWFKSKDIIQFS